METEGHYVCGECGEQVVIPIDITQGQSQQYVEDCPVCCRPNIVSVFIRNDGEVDCQAELE